MKAYAILAALALGAGALAEAIPAEEHQVAARQWEECVWTGHCAGDTCKTELDCDGELGCVSGKCAVVGGSPTTARTTARTTVRTTARTTARPTTIRTTVRTTARPAPTSVAGCVWEGHCAGATCTTENDCDGQLGCVNGRCATVGGNPVPTTSVRQPPGVITVTVTRTAGQPQPTPTTRPTPTGNPGGGNQNPSCGDSPLACIGASCRTDADCGFTLIICNDGICGL
ncbi:hypothetical protein V8F33_006628 [Rhypophila sp. PSN 637]